MPVEQSSTSCPLKFLCVPNTLHCLDEKVDGLCPFYRAFTDPSIPPEARERLRQATSDIVLQVTLGEMDNDRNRRQ